MTDGAIQRSEKQFRLMQTSEGKQALAIIAHLVAKLGGKVEISFSELSFAEDGGCHMQFNHDTNRMEIYANGLADA